MNEEKCRRAYELLQKLYDNDMILNRYLIYEIRELMTPEWIQDIDEENL